MICVSLSNTGLCGVKQKLPYSLMTISYVEKIKCCWILLGML